MDPYRSLLRPLLFRLDAETAHTLARRAMAAGFPWGMFGNRLFVRDPRLQTEVAGLSLANPLGLAPGLDKRGDTVPSLQQLGFGYVTVGTIMPDPRRGNPRPRLWRYPGQESLINCYGQPSDGLDASITHLRRVRRRTTRVLAIIGGFSVDDYVRSFEAIQPLVDAVEISTRCPNNVDDDGAFLHRLEFERMLQALGRRKQKPLFVKVSPWETEAEHAERLHLLELCLRYGVDGFTVPGTRVQPEPRLAMGWGNVSGPMIFQRTLSIVRELYQLARGRVAIKALGGISSGQDALAAIAAGASLVEILTCFVYKGWRAAWQINHELLHLMAAHGFPSIAALRGTALSDGPAPHRFAGASPGGHL